MLEYSFRLSLTCFHHWNYKDFICRSLFSCCSFFPTFLFYFRHDFLQWQISQVTVYVCLLYSKSSLLNRQGKILRKWKVTFFVFIFNELPFNPTNVCVLFQSSGIQDYTDFVNLKESKYLHFETFIKILQSETKQKNTANSCFKYFEYFEVLSVCFRQKYMLKNINNKTKSCNKNYAYSL